MDLNSTHLSEVTYSAVYSTAGVYYSRSLHNEFKTSCVFSFLFASNTVLMRSGAGVM